LLVAQGGALIATSAVSNDNARKIINANLVSTANLFRKTLASRGRILLDKARLLSSDFAFKQAFATDDHGTLLSALENHRVRAGADRMMLLSMDNKVLADTLHPDRHGTNFESADLTGAVMESETGEIESIEIMDQSVYQVVLVPLFTPEPSAMILIGFIMNDAFAVDLSHTTNDTEVSLLRSDKNGEWQVFATTMASDLSSQLLPHASDICSSKNQIFTLSMSGKEYISMVVPFEKHGIAAIALLQRSLYEQLSDYRHLRQTLWVIFIMVITVSVIGAVFTAKSVVRPVQSLEQGAQRIASGDFEHRVDIRQQDELGRLASTFNSMAKGLEERDKVRNLLGKVVSPEIAEELLKKDIVLGGEEREVTVLFSDIRSFTTLCENLSPQQVVNMLNTYLTRINTEIEKHKGVVDKYIGDAVMALFGAPLKDSNAASNAIGAGLAMLKAAGELNITFLAQGIPELKIGVGIHTDIVLAGNMGSASRMNYTVIGDGVNLASRLESLSKYYGVNMIASESTREQANGFIYRELDRVRVKGKSRPVTIFEPICESDSMSEDLASEIDRFHRALQAYRNQDWRLSHSIFSELFKKHPRNKLYGLYRIRVEILMKNPPDPQWDGVFIHKEK
jgi:adenylate cyclase